MVTVRCYPDLAVLSGWSAGYQYTPAGAVQRNAEETLAANNVDAQLVLGSMLDAGKNQFAKTLAENNWTELGWYPSCHYEYAKAYPVHVFAKIQPKMPLQDWAPVTYVGLGCSVEFGQGPKPVLRDLTQIYHYGSAYKDQKIFTIWRWLHSYGRPVEAFNRLGFRKFATTTLASYWCWGLKPGEER